MGHPLASSRVADPSIRSDAPDATRKKPGSVLVTREILLFLAVL